MQDFTAILDFLCDCIVTVMGLDIPLGSDFSLKFGTIAIGSIAFTLLIRILTRAITDGSKTTKKGAASDD